MKTFSIVSISALCAFLALPTSAPAERLIPAHPEAPLAFTWPAVRDYTETVRVRRTHVVRRGYTARRAPAHRKRVIVSRSYEVSEWRYQSLRTGWRPLPYEFGPYSARVVVLR